MPLTMLFAALLALAAGGSQDPPSRDTGQGFHEEARVERVIVDAYVTDLRGDPIPDLTAADFRLRVDRRDASIESAEWIEAERPELASVPGGSGAAASAGVSSERKTDLSLPPGRLLILFFQTDLFEPSRARGMLRTAIRARRLVETLLPSDRAAVVSFDSHLKLRQDFTADHDKLLAAIHAAIRTGPPPPPDPDAFPSLARHFDFEAARRAVTPEKALAIVSRAAAPIVGAKSMIFFGWGLQTIGGLAGPNPRDTLDLADALPALVEARVSIFALDVVDVESHSLETTLSGIAEATGGFYAKTNLFPDYWLGRVRSAIAGRYVVVFRKPDLPRGRHSIDITLAGRRGRVMARTSYQD